jgi:hypothetical protein
MDFLAAHSSQLQITITVHESRQSTTHYDKHYAVSVCCSTVTVPQLTPQ